ncbi:WxL domain-containing protein [Enterococcus sp. 5H]|uniref:WxL domain-containing protein n=1 Tax=Enterococcus sp. 5H TaxID=1229490 RepID=UPI00230416B4|nr:WxL domain-containing protein [Enterococcus sp. 5H]MDA9470109.1 hypothetical protein [Enterococcus sp. 5H]
MKKIVGVTLLSTLLLSSVGFSSQAFAVPVTSTPTNAEVEYTSGDGPGIIEEDDKDPNTGKDVLGTGLPKNLYFGSHKITKNEETYQAHDKTSKIATTGKLKIDDARGDGTGWHIKVAQTGQFANGSSTLDNAKLSITTGAIDNLGGLKPSVGAGQVVELHGDPKDEKVIFAANAGEGNGSSSLALDRFDLDVAAGVEKIKGSYTAQLTWTVTDTPMK